MNFLPGELPNSTLDALKVERHTGVTKNGQNGKIALKKSNPNRVSRIELLRASCIPADEINPELSLMYTNRAAFLPMGERVRMANGSLLTKKDLLLKAIQCDSANPHAYYNLANMVNLGEKIQLLDGRVMGAWELYLQSLACDPGYLVAYHNLAYVLIHEVCDITNLKANDILFKALSLDDRFAEAYVLLGTILKPREVVRLPDGSCLTEEGLYRKAIECDSSLGIAYFNLSRLVPTGQKAMLNDGTILTKEELHNLAIKLDPSLLEVQC